MPRHPTPFHILFRLKLFGSASIDGPDGPLVGRPVQRRRLALLALLAVARRRGLTRDKVIGYLWPDADTERGRPLLSDSIYHVNHAVDGDAIVAIGDELRLDPERLPSDVWDFLEAIEQRDWQSAVELHAAPFLDGFFLPGCDELERWVDAERETLSRARGRALETLAEGAEQAGNPADAVRWWRLLAAQDPYSSRVALRLMRSLHHSGDAPAALRHAHVHSLMLREEMNVEPDAELLAFVEELRAGPRAAAPPERRRPSTDAGPAPAPAPAHTAQGPAGGKPPRGRRALVVASVFAVIMLAAFGARVLFRPRAARLQLGRVLQATQDPGLELEPALSPDGRLVAYMGPHGALMVRQVGGPEPIRIVHDGDGDGSWPAWTPDGRSVVFVSPRGIETVAALGGAPRLLVAGSGLDRGLSVAPDGRRFAYVSHDTLYAAPLAGGPPRIVTAGYEIYGPAWSHDGRWIAFVSGNVQYISVTDLGNEAASSVWVVPASGGRATRVTDERFLSVSPAWTASDDLLFVSDREGSRDIYQLRLSSAGTPVGAPVRLTTGLHVHGIGMSRDGSRLAYTSFTERSNIWSLPIRPHTALSVSQAQAVTRGDQTIENFGVSRDGRRVAFNSDLRGTVQVFILPLDRRGAEPRQLTIDTVGSYWADWSPDDGAIAFHRFHGERRQVFVMSVASGAPVQVTDGSQDERSPEWAPDGRRLMLLANWATHPAIHIVTRSANGRWSTPERLSVVVGGDTIAPEGMSAWSPDGRLIACGCGPGGLVLVPASGGPARRLASPYSTAGWDFPQWSADGRTVYHLSADASGDVISVVAVPVDGARPWIAVRFDDPTRPWHRFGFRVRKGRFYFTLGDRESDVWVADMR